MNKTHELTHCHKDSVLNAIRNLCQIFWGPDLDQCNRLRQGLQFNPFFHLDSLLSPDPTDTIEAIADFVNASEDLQQLLSTLEAAYVRLFVSHKTGICAPLYQSCYEYDGAPLMGPPALRMKARLRDKGLAGLLFFKDRVNPSQSCNHFKLLVDTG
ncbi:MAG: molecular chaperone TorD family protein [Deltaproteobacteria bacterium]|nr:molecular chaperone TorD family protein [Deltaproteobacteria bacterium]